MDYFICHGEYFILHGEKLFIEQIIYINTDIQNELKS